MTKMIDRALSISWKLFVVYLASLVAGCSSGDNCKPAGPNSGITWHTHPGAAWPTTVTWIDCCNWRVEHNPPNEGEWLLTVLDPATGDLVAEYSSENSLSGPDVFTISLDCGESRRFTLFRTGSQGQMVLTGDGELLCSDDPCN